MTPKKWSGMGRTENAVWGLCQGSGSKPYQSQIDLTEPAFKCSCPSRKFPCKHGLALFLLFAGQENQFPLSSPPDWVTKWIDGRTQRAATKEEKKDKAPPDPEAQAKTAAKRQKRVAEGVAELDLWLRDLVRPGLASLATVEPSFWEGRAARLTDAQAPGLARMVRELGVIPASGEGWQTAMLESIARIHLLLQAWHGIEKLPGDLQAEIRGLIGWTQSQDELLQLPGVADDWVVLGQRYEVEDRLQVQRSWLRGVRSGMHALILTFAFGNQAPFSGLVTGTQFEAELVFFPGSLPLRALIKKRSDATRPAAGMPHATFDDSLAKFSEALAANPWLQRYPIAAAAAVPVERPGGWFLLDEARKCVRVHPRFQHAWTLMALSGGHPVELFGEWNGNFFVPVTVRAEERLHEFDS